MLKINVAHLAKFLLESLILFLSLFAVVDVLDLFVLHTELESSHLHVHIHSYNLRVPSLPGFTVNSV